jgi:hypothetical protein
MTRIYAAGLLLGVFGLGFAETSIAQTLSPFCQGEYRKYAAQRGPKAFGVGSDGSCWWGYGQRDLAAAQAFVRNACVRNGRPGCRVTESSF